MSKIIDCKYECGTRLGDFDQEAHKYKEVDTGELHTQERCLAAKARLAVKQMADKERQTEISKQNEQKLKETTQGFPIAETKSYVDHTAAKPSKCKIFFSNYAPDVEREYEEFQKGKSFAWARAQSHVTKDEEDSVLFTIFLYYEEKI